MGYNYVKFELQQAVCTLANANGDVRSRLNLLALSIFKLNESDLTPELKKDWIWIENNLTKSGAVFLENGQILYSEVENTMRKIKNNTGSKIASRIVSLYFAFLNEN